MVERDIGDRAYPALPCIGRVEPAAQSDLDDSHLHAGALKPTERGGGDDLELRGWPVSARHGVGSIEDRADQIDEFGHADRRAVHDDPFAVGNEVWLGCLADAQPGFTQH